MIVQRFAERTTSVNLPARGCLSVIALSLAATALPSRAAAPDLAATLAPPMHAVARLSAEFKWNARFDKIVQDTPGGSIHGAKWKPGYPAWDRARKAFATRFARVLDAYDKSGELAAYLRAELPARFPGDESAQLAAALAGPAGAANIRNQALTTFVVGAMSSGPGGPQIGSPEWNAQMNALRRTFDERIGPAVPRDDGRHAAEANAFVADPLGRKLGTLWQSAAGKARVTIDGAMNRVLFDERETIQREIDAAAAGR
jgi:hypothetical protein